MAASPLLAPWHRPRWRTALVLVAVAATAFVVAPGRGPHRAAVPALAEVQIRCPADPPPPPDPEAACRQALAAHADWRAGHPGDEHPRVDGHALDACLARR